mmetsp:Transcript_87984/g.152437  ORF Transcript_87984/g.152437 Transcript_87984/m.152437 type:complete len:223 (+) Transcript_87984:143-811(+)
MAFMCCCAPNSADDSAKTQQSSADAVREISGDTNQPAAGLLGKTATPNFPAPVRTPRQEASENNGSPGAPGGSQRKDRAMTPREKEQEKARLQEIVKEFSRAAVTGINVNIIDAETQEVSSRIFAMDKYLYTLILKSAPGDPSAAPEQSFNMKDMSAIYKGPDVTLKAPKLSSVASSAMGVDFHNPSDFRLFFYFKDGSDRDKFYTCLKILRMSVDINHQKS